MNAGEPQTKSQSTSVVGYDGSDTARAALAYAAERVGTGGRLVIAHIVAPPTPFIDTQYYDRSLRRARERGEECMRDVEDLLGGVPAELCVAEGPPARTLVELARDSAADEIVVGSRGHGADAPCSAASRTRCCTRPTDL